MKLRNNRGYCLLSTEALKNVARHPKRGYKKEEGWNRMYQNLRIFKTEHGHCLVPKVRRNQILISKSVHGLIIRINNVT